MLQIRALLIILSLFTLSQTSWAIDNIASFLSSETTSSTDINQATAYPFKWTYDNIDENTFAHDVTSYAHEIYVKADGNYLVSYSIPVNLNSDSRQTPRIEIRINGVVQSQTRAESGYMRNADDHMESSLHLTTLLPGLHVNDKIELYTQQGGGAGAVTTPGAKLFIEKLDAGESLFYAKATQSINSTNLNQSTAYGMKWVEQIESGDFSHDDVSSPNQITVNTSGDYLLFLNIPLTENFSCSTRESVQAQIQINGTPVSGALASQGYIRCAEGHDSASLHWFGLLPNVTAGEKITVDVKGESSRIDASYPIIVPTSRVASILIQKISTTSKVISMRATQLIGTTNWNATSGADILWSTEDKKDAALYTHSTSSAQNEITVTADGDYFVVYSHAHSSAVQRASVNVRVKVNNSVKEGGECNTGYIRNLDSHSQSSCSLTFLLEKLRAGDKITLTSAMAAKSGTVSLLGEARLTIIQKGQTPSNFNINDIPNKILHLDASKFDSVIDSSGRNANDLSFTLAEVKQWSDTSNSTLIHNATQSNVSSMPDFSRENKQITFDGVNDYFKIADNADMNLKTITPEKTIAVVLRTGTDVTTTQLIYEEGGTVRGMNAYISGGRLYIAMWNNRNDGDGTQGFTSSSAPILPETNYYATLVIDYSNYTGPSGPDGELRGHINGTKFSAIGTTTSRLYAHSGDIGIGAMVNDTYYHTGTRSGTGDYFNGDIYELIVYNKAIDDNLAVDFYNYFTTKWPDPYPVRNINLISQYTASSSATPVVTWDASNTPDVVNYEMAIGTSAGANDTNDWTDIGNVTSHSFTGLTLTECSDYYASVRTIDTEAKISTALSTDWFRYDGTSPSAPSSLVIGGTASASSSKQISWSSSSDNCSFSHYEIAIGTTAGATDVKNWTDIGNVSSYQFTGLTLTSATDYYFTIRGFDQAGNQSSVVNSAAWQIDTCVASDITPPTIPASLTSSGNAGSTSSPQHSWSASTDSCGFSHYEIAVGTTAGGTQAVNWTPIGNITSYKLFNITPALTTSTDYFTSIRAVDLAGNSSASATTTAWQLTPPGDVDPTGLELWLDADDLSTLFTDSGCSSAITTNGQNVGCWKDKSGLGRNGTSAVRPTYYSTEFNNKPVIRFDGSDVIDFTSIDTIRTLFIVNKSSTTSWQQLLGHTTSRDFHTNDATLLGTSASSNLINGSWRVNRTDINGPQNFSQTGQYSIISVVTTGNVSADHIASDRKQNGRFFTGDVVEVIAFSRVLSATEVGDIENYLNTKWFETIPAPVTNFTLSSNYTQDSSQTPTVSWTQSVSSDIDHYEVALGTSAGGNDIAGWINIGLTASYQFNSLNLASCSDYFISIKSVDADGYESAVQSSEYVRFDNTAPSTPGALNLSGTANETTSQNLTWASASDNCSTVSYKIALGSSPGSNDLINWTAITSTSHQFTGITPALVAATDYYLSVKSVDEAGNESPTSPSNAWQLSSCVATDTTAPTAPGSLTLSNIAKLTSSREGNWTASSDACGMSHYEVSLGTTSGGTQTVAWTNVGNTTSHMFSAISPYLQYDTDYYINVRGVDLAGNTSATTSSSAFRLQAPGGVSAVGMNLWLDTSQLSTIYQDSGCLTSVNSDNQNVGCIFDLSGNDNHGISSNSSEQPVYRSTSFNARPSVYFDGSANEFLDFGVQTDIRTVFWVLKEDSSNPGNQPFLLGDPNGSSYDFFGGVNTIFDSGSVSTNVSGGTLNLNGGNINGTATSRPTTPAVLSIVTTGNVRASAFSRDRISTAATRTWGGDLAEIIIFNRALGAAEVTAVEDYLQTKWGISSSETHWNGSISTDWFNASNWSNGIPSSSKDCIIEDTANDPQITGGQTAICRHMTIGTGHVKIESGTSSTLEIWGNLSIDPTGDINTLSSGNNYNVTLRDSGVETGTNTFSINSASNSNLGHLSFIKTAGDIVRFQGKLEAESIDIPGGTNFKFQLDAGASMVVNGDFTQSSAQALFYASTNITIAPGSGINISGGSFEVNGVADFYPQDMTNKSKFSPIGGVGSWSFTATGGSVSLQGFWFDKIDTSGLNLQGNSNITALSGGQFTGLQTDYTTPVSAIQLNTTTTVSLSVAYDIGFYWGDANNVNDDISDAPVETDSYYLVKANDCGNGNIYFDQWHGDFYSGDPAFNTEAKILDTDDSAVNTCQVSIDIAASPVNITSFTATPYEASALIQWTTSDELHHQGFNLYRSTQPDEGYSQINNEMIRNIISSTTFKGDYRFNDTNLTNDTEYFYMIEDVGNDGSTELHGPISVIPTAGLGTIPAASADENQTTPITTIEDLGNGVTILARTAHSLRIKIEPSNLIVSDSLWNTNHKKVEIPGYSQMLTEKHPQLLTRTILIPVPSSFTTVEKVEKSIITSDQSASLLNKEVVPAPIWTLNTTTEVLEASWEKDATAYNLATPSPSLFYHVATQTKQIGQHNYLPITVWPLQYTATTKNLMKLDELVLDIGLDGAIWNSPAPTAELTPAATEGNIRITVTQKGMHKITFDQLTSGNIDGSLSAVDINTLRLYYHDIEMPLEVISTDGFFNSGDSIVFYAPFTEVREDGKDQLILTTHDYVTSDDDEDFDDFYRFFDFNNQQSSAQISTLTSHTVTKTYEENNREMFDEPIGGEEDHFYWGRIVTPLVSGVPQEIGFTANFDNLITTSDQAVHIKVYLKGHPTSTSNPIHNLALKINGVQHSNIEFQQQDPHVITFTTLANELNVGNNAIAVRSLGDKVVAGDYDAIDINKIEIDYPSYVKAVSNSIELKNLTPDMQIEIGNFTTQSVKIYDISSPIDGLKYTNYDVDTFDGGTTYQISFDTVSGSQGQAGKHLIAIADSALLTPSSLSLTTGYEVSLKDSINSYDYIIIGHDNLLEAASNIIELRTSEGLRVLPVTYQQIYDEFSYGRVSSQAIKDFILYARSYWQIKPEYALLMGEPTYDPQNILGWADQTRLIPMPLVKGILTDFGSPGWFATPEKEEDAISEPTPIIALGWLPTSNPVKIQNYAQKLIGYESGEVSPIETQAKKAVLIAGQDTNHERFDQKVLKLAGTLTSAQPDYQTETVIRAAGDSAAQMKTHIVDSFDKAPLFLSYLGHGAEEMWEGYDTFTVDDIPDLTNTRLPIVEALNCLNGYFYDADTTWETLGENLVFKEQGGAIAFWGSTTMTAPTSQVNLASSLFTQLAADTSNGFKVVRLGDLMLSAKAQQANDRMSLDTVKSWVLIGDPALKLPEKSFSASAKISTAPAAPTGGGGCSAFGSDGHQQVGLFTGLIYFLFELLCFTLIYLIARKLRRRKR